MQLKFSSVRHVPLKPSRKRFRARARVRGDRCLANRILAVDGGPRSPRGMVGASGGVDRVGDRVLCSAVPVPTDSDGIIHILGAESPGGALCRARG